MNGLPSVFGGSECTSAEQNPELSASVVTASTDHARIHRQDKHLEATAGSCQWGGLRLDNVSIFYQGVYSWGSDILCLVQA